MRERVIEAFHQVCPLAEAFEDSLNLIDDGYINSMGLFALIVELEAEFNIEIPEREMQPDNFCSIDQITALVKRLARGTLL